MKSQLLAVFGHYDSRGGTTGMPIEAPTKEALDKAISEYNELFDFEGMVRDYKKNPAGWMWDPTKPGSSPGENDLMFIAQLHYPDELPEATDLEDLGVVLIDEATEPDLELAGVQIILMNDTRVAAKEIAKNFGSSEQDITIRNKQRILEAPPTQLEFIPLDDGKYTVKGRLERDGPSHPDDEKAFMEFIKAKAQVLKGDEVKDRSWNDDAFGFIIGTGLEDIMKTITEAVTTVIYIALAVIVAVVIIPYALLTERDDYT